MSLLPSRKPLPQASVRKPITVEGADHPYEQIRIENTLTVKNGDEVQLKAVPKCRLVFGAETARPR
jgi:hypothetical protein